MARAGERASRDRVAGGKAGRLLSALSLNPSGASPSIIGATASPAEAAAATTVKSALRHTNSNLRPSVRSASIAAAWSADPLGATASGNGAFVARGTRPPNQRTGARQL